MGLYSLIFTVPSPSKSAKFMEFSPDGRFLAVGDRDHSMLYILDRLAGFYPKISATMFAHPTALVWETSETFYVGLSNGYFVHYQIDLKGNRLAEGVVDCFLRDEGFPITEMALDAESRTLVMSVGPGVFVFRRIRATSKFHFVSQVSTRFHFTRDPGTPAPPFPRSICFAPNNVLIITFCRQYIASVVLEFDDNLQLRSSSQTAKIDYSGLPLLKVITSANEEEVHRLKRVWVYGNASETGGGNFPFLFINGGAATLSGSPFGIAIICDTITHRQIQLLEHAAITSRPISVMAYHVSNGAYNIATADHGADATIKIWTAQRRFLHSKIQHNFSTKNGWAILTFMTTLIVAVLITPGILDINEVFPKISRVYIQYMLALIKAFNRIGYLALDPAVVAGLDAGDVQG